MIKNRSTISLVKKCQLVLCKELTRKSFSQINTGKNHGLKALMMVPMMRKYSPGPRKTRRKKPKQRVLLSTLRLQLLSDNGHQAKLRIKKEMSLTMVK